MPTSFEYKETFAVPGAITSEEVTCRMAELDPFLEGYFLGLAQGEKFPLWVPAVDSFQHTVIDEEKFGFSRVHIEVGIIFLYEEDSYRSGEARAHFDTAMNAFLKTRFQQERRASFFGR